MGHCEIDVRILTFRCYHDDCVYHLERLQACVVSFEHLVDGNLSLMVSTVESKNKDELREMSNTLGVVVCKAVRNYIHIISSILQNGALV